jgi:hypothetical protein
MYSVKFWISSSRSRERGRAGRGRLRRVREHQPPTSLAKGHSRSSSTSLSACSFSATRRSFLSLRSGFITRTRCSAAWGADRGRLSSAQRHPASLARERSRVAGARARGQRGHRSVDRSAGHGHRRSHPRTAGTTYWGVKERLPAAWFQAEPQLFPAFASEAVERLHRHPSCGDELFRSCGRSWWQSPHQPESRARRCAGSG